MYNLPLKFILLALALVSLLFYGCGGGSSSGESSSKSGSQVTSGVITGFGSVFVNGVEFDLSGSEIEEDDEDFDEDDLEIGQVVVITGKVDSSGKTGKADSVEVENELEGAIVSISNNSFVVLETTVLVDDFTVFKDVQDLNSLAVGNIVEVSGFFNSNGEIQATKVELEDEEFEEGSSEIKLKGTIQNLSETNQTFQLGDQTVDYSSAELEKIPESGIENGLLVKVKSEKGIVDGVLIASEVKGKKKVGDNGDEVKLEGLVTSFTSSEEFSVNGQPVQTDSNTEFENGSSTDLALDVKVKVEGELNDKGVLVAEEVKFKIRDDIEIEALVDSVDAANGTITLLGITVQINNFTQMEDDEDEDNSNFNLSSISAGDFVEIKGYLDSDGNVIASKLEREDDEDEGEVELKGPLDSVSEPNFVILGVTIQTSSDTDFESIEGSSNDSTGVFETVNIGDIVEVEGTFADGILTAEEVELEEEDDDEEGDGDDDDDDD